MSREQAWKWADKAWLLWEPANVEDKTLCRVQESLRRLQQSQMPIAAIEEVTTLLKAHEKYVLESVECSKCGHAEEEEGAS